MMQAATHPNLLPPFPATTYSTSGAIEHKSLPSTSTNGSNMQSHAMMPAKAAPVSNVRGNLRFALVVEQQPIRARMCGFGDKDRRPITPPPCIRVVITDATTGREVSYDEVDSTFFILQVDLWDESASEGKNVVRASSNSPAVSISTATTTSFPPQPDRPVFGAGQVYPPQYVGGPAPPAPYQQGYPPGQSLPPMYQQGPPVPPGYYAPPQYPSQYAQVPPTGSPGFPQGYSAGPPAPYVAPQAPVSSMYTRNLIGSLSVNAFTLNDTEEKTGHWFVLQDLSVRTEGNFRLKMSFIDVGKQVDAGNRSRNTLNQGKAPVLASVFSQPFHVFSAKKFPGVIESTPLSRCFAGQGIKIPIRKDGLKQEKDEDGDE